MSIPARDAAGRILEWNIVEYGPLAEACPTDNVFLPCDEPVKTRENVSLPWTLHLVINPMPTMGF